MLSEKRGLMPHRTGSYEASHHKTLDPSSPFRLSIDWTLR